jgi:hypothetical protein
MHPTAIALIYFLGMLIIGSAIQWTFLIKLKKHHSVQWEHAGKPTIFNNGDLIKAWPTTKYLLKTYMRIQDQMKEFNFVILSETQ